MDILVVILLAVLFSAIVIVLLTACISLPLLVIDWLVYRFWIGRKTHKYDWFYDLSVLWLTFSFKLPFKMYKRGAKYGWLGAGLMLVSPAAVVTYATAFVVQQVCFPLPLSENEIQYKTHEDLVAVTGLQDFPTFTYDHNVKDAWEGQVTVYYVFDQALSSEYNKKLNALCQDPDNYLWSKNGDYQYVLSRGCDGKYIKSSLKDGNIILSIGKNGFSITHINNFIGPIEDFAEAKKLNKNTGVTFPKYKIVNCLGGGFLDYQVVYSLLLDKKPSRQFIKQLENSPKWTKKGNGTYSCCWEVNDQWGKCVTVDKNSRVVRANYETY